MTTYPVARQVLRKLLTEPMRFEPVVNEGRKDYRISGVTKPGALLDMCFLTHRLQSIPGT